MRFILRLHFRPKTPFLTTLLIHMVHALSLPTTLPGPCQRGRNTQRCVKGKEEGKTGRNGIKKIRCFYKDPNVLSSKSVGPYLFLSHNERNLKGSLSFPTVLFSSRMTLWSIYKSRDQQLNFTLSYPFCFVFD